VRALLGLSIGLVLGCSQAQAAGHRFLASIAPPPLANGEFVGQFRIEVDGATVLSACHIPFGWQVTAGMYDGNSGVLAGEGGLGGSLVSKQNRNLNGLRDLFLVELRPGEDRPRFEGSMEIGRYGTSDRRRKVRVTPRLLTFSPATHCPAAAS
jgi:hypothetical protein